MSTGQSYAMLAAPRADVHAGRAVRERTPATVAVMTTFRSRDVHLLVGAAGLSALGDLALGIPLALEVRAKTGSALAVSLFFLCMFGPIVLLAGVAGRLVDRVENRRLLIAVSLAQAGATSLLLLADSAAALLVAHGRDRRRPRGRGARRVLAAAGRGGRGPRRRRPTAGSRPRATSA